MNIFNYHKKAIKITLHNLQENYLKLVIFFIVKSFAAPLIFLLPYTERASYCLYENMINNNKVDFRTIFRKIELNLNQYFKILIILIISLIIISSGILLLYISAIIFFFAIRPVGYLITKEDNPTLENTILSSFDIMKGHKFTMFILELLNAIIIIILILIFLSIIPLIYNYFILFIIDVILLIAIIPILLTELGIARTLYLQDLIKIQNMNNPEETAEEIETKICKLQDYSNENTSREDYDNKNKDDNLFFKLGDDNDKNHS